jgi:hypothetical protein
MAETALPEIFGANVFSDRVMKERLPKDTYKALRQTIDRGAPLKPELAAVVANAMKDWAIEKGASRASPTRRRSRAAACAAPSKRAATRRGTAPRRRSSRRTRPAT